MKLKKKKKVKIIGNFCSHLNVFRLKILEVVGIKKINKKK